MNRERISPLKRQLQLFITMAVGLSILIMGIIWMTYNRISLEQQAERISAIQAEMIGSALRPAMMFKDAKLARDLIDQLKTSPDIVSMTIISSNGKVLASFPDRGAGNNPLPTMKEDKIKIDGDRLKLFRTVIYKEAAIGAIYLEYNLADLKRRQQTDTINIIFIMSGTLLFGFFIAMRLQRRLTESEQKLRAATEAAEKASRAKSDFLSTISHELRTPIHGIIGLQRLISKDADNLNDEQRENLLLAQQSAKSLQSLVNDILDLSKIESGKVEVNRRTFDLQGCVCDAFVPFRPLAAEKNIALSLHIEQTPKWISCDDTLLRQILINLISNAIKFTDQGEVNIRVIRADETLKFEVSDTGRGIAEADMKDLFEPFVQVADSRMTTQKGTGLGTSIVKRYVELLGGKVEVSSTLGKGSCFAFSIPCLAVGDESCDYQVISDIYKAPPETTPTNIPVPETLRLKILLAEDDPIGQRIATRIFARAGMAIDVVENGHDAWQKLQDHDYDLLITDIRMPGIDGIELTRRIRQLEQESARRRMIIIGLSAHALEEVANDCLAAGMDRFMAKPVDPDVILATVVSQREEGNL